MSTEELGEPFKLKPILPMKKSHYSPLPIPMDGREVTVTQLYVVKQELKEAHMLH